MIGQVYEKVGHQASHCFILHDLLRKTYKGKYCRFKGAYMAHVSLSESPYNLWLFDTSASHHLVVDISNVHQSVPYLRNDGFSLGHGNMLPIHCIGK